MVPRVPADKRMPSAVHVPPAIAHRQKKPNSPPLTALGTGIAVRAALVCYSYCRYCCVAVADPHDPAAGRRSNLSNSSINFITWRPSCHSRRPPGYVLPHPTSIRAEPAGHPAVRDGGMSFSGGHRRQWPLGFATANGVNGPRAGLCGDRLTAGLAGPGGESMEAGVERPTGSDWGGDFPE
jgi:hypothetical protein